MSQHKTPYYLIGITGGSASGKSLLIQTLRSQFSEEELCIISQDDYYKSIDQQQADEHGVHNFDLLESIDSEQMYNDLLSLAEGKDVVKKEYIFERKDKEAIYKTFKPAPVVIVEGLFIFAVPAISSLIDLSVFIDCDSELRFERRLKRDVVERGIPEDKVLHQWKHHVIPAHKSFIKPYRKTADIVINNYNNMKKGIDLLSNHIRMVLNDKN
jgi:uridine kinase